MEWFDGKMFQGIFKLKVFLPQKKPLMNSMQVYMLPRESRGMLPLLCEGAEGTGGPGGPIGPMGVHGGDRGGFLREVLQRKKHPALSWRLAVPQSRVWKPELCLENTCNTISVRPQSLKLSSLLGGPGGKWGGRDDLMD